MSHTAEFNASAAELMKARGVSMSYRQGGKKSTLNIYIKRNLEIFDDTTQGGQFVDAAYIAKTDFPHDNPRKDDRIVTGGQDWRVLRRLKDNGTYLTLEIAKV